MTSQTISTAQNQNKVLFFSALLFSFLLSLFFYYIDEGNYNFNGLQNPIEWIFVGIYTAIFTGSIYLVYSFLRKTEMPFRAQLISSIILGFIAIPLLIIILSGIYYFIKAL